ncbi:hypothetical protein AA13594_0735 [Gluconacetobacter azotocaptans DSM 13594]|nr:hypothetical protein AA13594_0735 [Gluconacetobacter azotocaptans DSM 13594]
MAYSREDGATGSFKHIGDMVRPLSDNRAVFDPVLNHGGIDIDLDTGGSNKIQRRERKPRYVGRAPRDHSLKRITDVECS